MQRASWLVLLGVTSLFTLSGGFAGADTRSGSKRASFSASIQKANAREKIGVQSASLNASAPLIASWQWCANEYGWCEFSGTRKVAYGANGAFAYKWATNGIACNNANFGDPLVGVDKACYLTD